MLGALSLVDARADLGLKWAWTVRGERIEKRREVAEDRIWIVQEGGGIVEGISLQGMLILSIAFLCVLCSI